MSQLTIYLDNETRTQIEKAAKRADVSISTWVKERLQRSLANEWSENYFSLFGALGDCDLEPATPLSFDDDATRNAIP